MTDITKNEIMEILEISFSDIAMSEITLTNFKPLSPNHRKFLLTDITKAILGKLKEKENKPMGLTIGSIDGNEIKYYTK